jgi:hypothetical protein
LRAREIFQRLRRLRRAEHAFVVNDADDHIAIARAEDRIDGFFGELRCGRRVVFRQHPFLGNQSGHVRIKQYRVVKRFPAAVLAHGPLHRFGAGGAPVLELETGLFFKARFDGVECFRFQRAVGDDFAAFLFGCLD